MTIERREILLLIPLQFGFDSDKEHCTIKELLANDLDIDFAINVRIRKVFMLWDRMSLGMIVNSPHLDIVPIGCIAPHYMVGEAKEKCPQLFCRVKTPIQESLFVNGQTEEPDQCAPIRLDDPNHTPTFHHDDPTTKILDPK